MPSKRSPRRRYFFCTKLARDRKSGRCQTHRRAHNTPAKTAAANPHRKSVKRNHPGVSHSRSEKKNAQKKNNKPTTPPPTPRRPRQKPPASIRRARGGVRPGRTAGGERRAAPRTICHHIRPCNIAATI